MYLNVYILEINTGWSSKLKFSFNWEFNEQSGFFFFSHACPSPLIEWTYLKFRGKKMCRIKNNPPSQLPHKTPPSPQETTRLIHLDLWPLAHSTIQLSSLCPSAWAISQVHLQGLSHVSRLSSMRLNSASSFHRVMCLPAGLIKHREGMQSHFKRLWGTSERTWRGVGQRLAD